MKIAFIFSFLIFSVGNFAFALSDSSRIQAVLNNSQVLALESELQAEGYELAGVMDTGKKSRCYCTDYKLVFKSTTTPNTPEDREFVVKVVGDEVSDLRVILIR